MKILISIILSILSLTLGLKAQEAHEHHPTRIIISFETESEIYNSFWDHLGAKGKMTAGENLGAPEVSEFMESTGLMSLNKLVDVNNFSRKKAATLDRSSSKHRAFVGEVADPEYLMDIIQLLNSSEGIEFAEPDYVARGGGQLVAEFEVNSESILLKPNDPFYQFQWGLENTGQTINGFTGTANEDINPDGAWDMTQGSADITVAVLDTGLPDNVPDMNSREVEGFNYVSGNEATADDHGHGTSVASIALSTGNNGAMISGVDWKAQIMPIKVLDENNSGLNSYSVNGIYYAVDNGAEVLNISVGSTGDNQIYRDAVKYAADAGVIIVACMMNENTNTPNYPAAYESVFAIGATNENGERAVPFTGGGDGSNYGDHIDLVAPGNLIASLKHDDNSSVSLWSGTSQATPLVTGTVSLMLSVNPDLTAEQVRQILIETARGDGEWDQFLGWGKLDATAAVKKAEETPTNIEEENNTETVTTFKLGQNYPNPFNPVTNIGFELPQASEVTLKVYDMLGREVAALMTNTRMSTGAHTVAFEASELPSGIYLYQLEAGEWSQTKKMSLIK
jgi:subtilisin family serine protease